MLPSTLSLSADFWLPKDGSKGAAVLRSVLAATDVKGWVSPKIGGIDLFSLLLTLVVIVDFTPVLLFSVATEALLYEAVGVVELDVEKEKPVNGVLTFSWGTLFVKKAGRGGAGSSSSSISAPRPVILFRNLPPPSPPREDNGVENAVRDTFGGGGGTVDDESSRPAASRVKGVAGL